jgi:tetratricopeptide (TPR) repeat protein
MAVAFNKTILAILLSSIAAVACATKESGMEEQRVLELERQKLEQVEAAYEKKLAEYKELQVLELARQKYEQAKANQEKKIIECQKKAKSTVLSPSLFEALDLTHQELKSALFVLSHRAREACEGSSMGDVIVAAGVYRTTAQHYEREAASASYYTEDMLLGYYWRILEFEARYLTINPEKRKILESIPQFQEPFDLFRTLDGIPDKTTK